MASPTRVNASRYDAISGALVAAALLGLPVVVTLQWSRVLHSPDAAVGIVCFVAIGVTWLLITARLLFLTVQLLRGEMPLAATGGVVWLASLIVTVITLGSPAGSPTALAHPAAPLASSVATVSAGVRDVASPSFSVIPGRPTDASAPPLSTLPTGHVRSSGWTPPDLGQLLSTADVALSNAVLAPPTAPTAPTSRRDHSDVPLWPVSTLGSLPLAMVAKRRRDFLTQSRLELADDEVDASIAELRGYSDEELRRLRQLIGPQRSGLLVVEANSPADALDDDDDGDKGNTEPLVVVLVAVDASASLVAFAHVGESMPLGRDAVELVDRFGTVLSGRGLCRVATTPHDVVRTLALRSSFDDVVVYLGASNDLDPEIAQRCVTVGDGPPRRGGVLEWQGHKWSFASPTPTPQTMIAPRRHESVRLSDSPATIRVQLLRAEPAVVGLVEPFAATLRRRCVEMTSYLAVHYREPITGERLRSRVLGSGDDASLRTLSNTATAVRRSLGSDSEGPRLHAVTPSGLYQVHDVTCDVVEFHQLVAMARDPLAVGVSATLRLALELVQGEPLATALRGFEWFLAEGHLARLHRDGEWAALRLAAEAREVDDYDLAFWAIERGRLIDPYSEALESALHRVPRLREFRRDGSSGAQNQPVGTR